MKALVCGGRDFRDRRAMYAVLDDMDITSLIHGGARGADDLAGQWALFRKVPCRSFYAKWERYGRAAGARRNVEMIEQQPDIVIAFPGGKGTANMVALARKHGVKVVDHNQREPEAIPDASQVSMF